MGITLPWSTLGPKFVVVDIGCYVDYLASMHVCAFLTKVSCCECFDDYYCKEKYCSIYMMKFYTQCLNLNESNIGGCLIIIDP